MSKFPIIDTDIHQGIPDSKAFNSYLPEYWRGKGLPGQMSWPGGVGRSMLRVDATPPGGGRPGTELVTAS